jgi:dihydrodipicolinate synthase/N-acetylneuraminate lyase
LLKPSQADASLSAKGGILASAHLETRSFIAVSEWMRANDYREAHTIWSRLETLMPLLFREANPIAECRSPLTRISTAPRQRTRSSMPDR